MKFERIDGSTLITCAYDYMGRRFEKQVTTNGTITTHQRFIYRNYLQIAAVNLKANASTPDQWFLIWDPTQPIATRPLALRKDGVWYTYGWDLTKNICELYGQQGYIRTIYRYSPYGIVTAEGDVTQPIQWSSEFNDSDLGLVYYNYRYYNPTDGRWIRRDFYVDLSNRNLYSYIQNNSIFHFDALGLNTDGVDVAYLFFSVKDDITNKYTRKTRVYLYDSIQTITKVDDFKPNETCTKCIKELTIYAHGAVIDGDAYMYLGLGEYDALRERSDGSEKNISQLFINANINFCDDATLNIRSCYIGLVDSIKTDIENHYKAQGKNLTVNVYKYNIWPSGIPNVVVLAIKELFEFLDAIGEGAKSIYG